MHYGVGGSFTHLRLPDNEAPVFLVGHSSPIKICLQHRAIVSSPHFTLNDPEPNAETECGPPQMTITWTRTPGLVGPTYVNLPVALCTASTEREPSARARSAYETLAERRLPEGHNVPEVWDDVAADGTIKENHTIPMQYMPQALQDDALKVFGQLSTEANRVVRLMRWRFAAEIEYRPIAFSHYFFSFDSKLWHTMPHSTGVAWGLGVTVLPSAQEIGTEVGNLLAAGASEPFAHVLYGEAWQQRNDNPRSAIVMGISAAEVGFKRFASQVAPVTAWLMENVPSPPLLSLIWEYLPTLVADLPARTPNLVPPRDDRGRPSGVMAKAILDGVGIRNKVVHAGGESIKGETVERILKGVADLLWLLDFFQGYDWAIDHVSETTRNEWASPD